MRNTAYSGLDLTSATATAVKDWIEDRLSLHFTNLKLSGLEPYIYSETRGAIAELEELQRILHGKQSAERTAPPVLHALGVGY